MKHLIWAMWISSLSLGYVYIVTAIVTGVFPAKGVSRKLRAIGGLFLLGFFTLHFGVFHAVHGTFVNRFFPLAGDGGESAGIFTLILVAMKTYWPVVLTSFVSRLDEFPFRGVDWKRGDLVARPYLTVVRMHVLILVFAGLHLAHLGRLAAYPVLLAYFFPWGAWLRHRKAVRKQGRPPERASGQGSNPPADPQV